MLNVNLLKYFVDSVQLRGITQAAKANNISVSAVSQAIKSLEDQLETPLLLHKKNRFQLTAEGQQVYRKALNIFSEVDELEQDLKSAKNEMYGRISFATQQSLASVILPKFLIEFKKKFPKVTPHFLLGTTSLVSQWLDSGEVDFAISLDNVNYPKCHKTKILKGEFVSIMKKGMRSSSLKYLTTEDTKEVKKLRQIYLREKGAPLPVEMVIGSWGVIYQMALEGVGIGFLPDYYLDNKSKNYTVLKTQLAPIHYRANVYHRKTKRLSPMALTFINELVQFYASGQKKGS